jgi:hypothetical protein
LFAIHISWPKRVPPMPFPRFARPYVFAINKIGDVRRPSTRFSYADVMPLTSMVATQAYFSSDLGFAMNKAGS